MLSLLFIIFFFMVFGKVIGFAFRATWSVMKVLFGLVILPIIIVTVVFGGIFYFVLPVVLVFGLIGLIAKKC